MNFCHMCKREIKYPYLEQQYCKDCALLKATELYGNKSMLRFRGKPRMMRRCDSMSAVVMQQEKEIEK